MDNKNKKYRASLSSNLKDVIIQIYYFLLVQQDPF